MENIKAIELIDKIFKNLDETGINTDTLIEDIKELRGYAIEQKVPLLVKVLRLTYEHIEKYDSFVIPILDDEPLEEADDLDVTNEESSPVENLKYVLALAKNLNNKGNIADLKEYKALLMDY
ncbi:hypothetical protein [Psychroserpens damuponensis]|uniref:hypothetical protein n=1 Tax=Psychroserpens damuponensis TaxID=943936 RepID=UPI00058C19D7|nr:hypothetical protein [Psychroserpens damuponensis]